MSGKAKIRRRCTRLLIVGSLLGLAACAQSTQWRHPQLPPAEWAKDEAACRRWAAAEVEKDVAQDQAVFGDPSLDRTGTYQTQMARYDATKARRTLTARCLSARGYVKAKR